MSRLAIALGGFFWYHIPMLKFLGKTLLFVVAHPDDESFTAAGTMLQNRKQGGKNYIACATFGEKGQSHLSKPVSENQLKRLRKQELEQAAKYLKVNGLFFLNLPDTKVQGNLRILQTKLGRIIKKLRPDYVFGFGPDGISGHLDHIAAGRAAQAAAKKLKLPFIAFAASPALIKSFAGVKTRRKHGKYAKAVKHAAYNLKVKINYSDKLRTLKFHKSQFGQSTMLADFPKSVRKGFMAYEYFVQ